MRSRSSSVSSASSASSVEVAPGGNPFANLVFIAENTNLEPLDLFGPEPSSSFVTRSSILSPNYDPNPGPSLSTLFSERVGQSESRSRQAAERSRRRGKQGVSDSRTIASAAPLYEPYPTAASRKRETSANTGRTPRGPSAKRPANNGQSSAFVTCSESSSSSSAHHSLLIHPPTLQPSLPPQYFPMHNSDDSDLEYLVDPYGEEEVPEHYTFAYQLKHNLITWNSSLAHSPFPFYSTPPGSPSNKENDGGHARIFAILRERDERNPPDPTALHIMLHPHGETPSTTFVDLNSSNFKIFINPTFAYDDRDLMVPAVASRSNAMKIVIDWPFEPIDSLPSPQMTEAVCHYDTRFGDDVVSVEDIFNAIYRFMRTSAQRQQYYEYSVEDRRSITQAYHSRCRDWPQNPLRGGLLYVDFLGGKHRFIGLERRETRDGIVWVAQFE